MFFRTNFPIALTLFFATPSLSAADPPVPATTPPLTSVTQAELPCLKYQLDNGLEVIMHQDRTLPLVAVNVWYHVGSGDETPQKSGFAHLFEHMMFQGSQNVGEDMHFEILQKIGGTSINGTTNSDRTNYFEVVPTHQLEIALWLESDRMGYMLPLLSEKSLANQREVVRNERRQRYDNVPYGKELFELYELLYQESHPYRYLTIGRHEDLGNASLEDVRSFFRKWYVPANATLVLAGDFDIEEAKTLVAKWFGSFPKTIKPAHRTVSPTPILATQRKEIDDPFAKLRRVHYAWHSPKIFDLGDAELDLLASILAADGTGRLYKTLVHEKQLAQNVAAFQGSAQFSSVFHLIVDLREDANLQEVAQLLDAELDRTSVELVTDAELKRALARVESGFVWGLESLLGRAELLQSYNHYLDTPHYIAQDLGRYRAVTQNSILHTAQTFLSKVRRAEVITTSRTSN